MISKVEYIRNIGSLKMYIRNNSFIRDIPMPIDSLLFLFWRCGYVEFVLPNGLNPPYIESINSYNKKENSIAKRIEIIIDNALVHSGVS